MKEFVYNFSLKCTKKIEFFIEDKNATNNTNSP